jgi:hypothetical protein
MKSRQEGEGKEMQVGCGDFGQVLDFQDTIYEAEKIDVPSYT